jgi:DMSO/TMAO reductase YedYZ heme-binding membrane subunit
MITSSFLADSLTVVATHRFATSWPWYVVRGAGFVAAGLIVLLMLSGIGQVTGLTYRFFEPVTAWAIHKALAYALLASIAIHVIFLLIDKFLPFSLAQVLVPFASTYSNKTSLFGLPLGWFGVAAGILAMYGVIIVVASSLKWIDTRKKAWRFLHYLSYAVAGLVFIHALQVGTDLRYGSFRLGWILLGLIVIAAVITRIWRAKTLVKDN